LEPVAQQARYDATKKTLDGIKSAIVTVNQSGNAAYVSGFVADLSFLPSLNSANDFHSNLTYGTGLTEAYAVTETNTGLSAVYGWRGPYLQSPVTATAFVDGWGRPYSAQIQDVAGNAKSAFSSLSDRLVITNAAVAATTSQLASTVITGSMISATQLTVNLYGLDVNGNRLTLTGSDAPFTTLPQVYLLGGISPTTGTITTLTGTVAASGTTCGCQFTPAIPQLLVGTRFLSVVTPTAATTNYETYSPTMQLNLLPGTSPVVDVLVVRQTSTVTGS
jgi:hypothetical protein